jgi:hypothetical protein
MRNEERTCTRGLNVKKGILTRDNLYCDSAKDIHLYNIKSI